MGMKLGAAGGATLLVAASLLLAFWTGIFSGQQENLPKNWGWLKEDTFAVEVQDDAFLILLADRAGEFESRPRGTRESLQSALVDFRQMCDVLQRSDLRQLSKQADRDWLKERCAAWAKKIDGHLAALDGGAAPLTEITSAAQATIEALQKALRTRAEQIKA